MSDPADPCGATPILVARTGDEPGSTRMRYANRGSYLTGSWAKYAVHLASLAKGGQVRSASE